MKIWMTAGLLFCMGALLLATQVGAEKQEEKSVVNAKLNKYIELRIAEFDQISDERKEVLDKVANYVAQRVRKDKPVSLNFICTHNSRRSHMSQIWAGTAAVYYNLKDVRTYSGGTESTAFNPRAVAAIERAGFDVMKTTEDHNPIYLVKYHEDAMPMTCFSKVFSQAPNPKEGFAAIMTCSDADKNCPFVEGCDARLGVTYVDPKVSDGTDKEAVTYDERCAQIAREMLYIMSRAAEMK